MQSIALVQTSDKDINQLQQNISQAVGPLLSNPFTNGNILDAQTLKIGQNLINHGLGYAITGYVVVGANAQYAVYDDIQSNSNLTNSFNLFSTTAVTVNIYVF